MRKLTVVFILIALIIITSGVKSYANVSSAAVLFLRIAAGARAAGMGEAFVAVTDDASSLFWNPAGLVQAPENQVFVAHTEYVADIRHEYLGAMYHLTDVDAVGIALALWVWGKRKK